MSHHYVSPSILPQRVTKQKKLTTLTLLIIIFAAIAVAIDAKQPSVRELTIDDIPSDRILRNKTPWRNDKRVRRYIPSRYKSKHYLATMNTRIIGFTTLVFAAQYFFPIVTVRGITISEKMLRGKDLYRFFTAMFLHAGVSHFFSNMYTLEDYGQFVEQHFGPGRYLVTYLVSGIVGDIFSIFLNPRGAGLGASGAIFGIIAAYFVYYFRQPWLFKKGKQEQMESLAKGIISGVVSQLDDPTIGHSAHFGGFVGGAIMAYYFGPRIYLVPNNDNNSSSGSTNKYKDKEDEKEKDENNDHESYFLVDVPLIRLPREVESLPSKPVRFLHRKIRRMINNFKFASVTKFVRKKYRKIKQQAKKRMTKQSRRRY